MYDKTIDSSEKLNIYYGAIYVSREEKKERTIMDLIIRDEEEEEDSSTDGYNTRIKERNEFRNDLINVLNIRGDVSNIKDLFEMNPEILNLNPFMFTLRIPYSAQKSIYREYLPDEPPSRCETFHGINNGFLMYVAGITTIDEKP